MDAQIKGTELVGRSRPGLVVRDQLGKSLFALALFGIPWSLAGAWSAHSLTFTLSAAGLVGWLLFGLTFVTLFAAPNALRALGLRRWGPAALLLVLAEMTATVAALEELPHTGVVDLPVLGAVGLAVIAAVGAVCLESVDDLYVPSGGAWWESASLNVVLFGVFSIALGRHHLSTWPSSWYFGLVMLTAVIITLHIAWLLTHDEPDDDLPQG